MKTLPNQALYKIVLMRRDIQTVQRLWLYRQRMRGLPFCLQPFHRLPFRLPPHASPLPLRPSSLAPSKTRAMMVTVATHRALRPRRHPEKIFETMRSFFCISTKTLREPWNHLWDMVRRHKPRCENMKHSSTERPAQFWPWGMHVSLLLREAEHLRLRLRFASSSAAWQGLLGITSALPQHSRI